MTVAGAESALIARVRGVGRGTAATILGRALDVVATYGFYALAARSLAMADFGRFVVAITMLQTLASACRFGLDQALLTIPPSGPANRFGVRLVATLALALAVLAALTLRLAGQPLSPFALWCCGALLPVAVGQFLFGALRARGAIMAAAIADGIVQPGSALLFAAIAVAIHPSLLSFALAFVLSWIATLPFAIRVEWKGPRIANEDASQLLTTGRSMFGVALLQQAATSADVLLLGFFVAAADVGRYAAAQKIAAAFLLLHGAVTTAVTPFMRALASDRRLLGDYYRIVTRWMLAGALPLLVVTTGAPALVLRLFGSAYAGSDGTVLRILSVAAVLVVVSGPVGSVLLCSGEVRSLFRVSVLGAFSIVAGVGLLAPFGVVGAAAGLLLGRAITRGSLMFALHRVIPQSAADGPLLWMAGGGLAGIVLTCLTAGPLGDLPAAALGCLVVVAAAATVLIRQGDVAFLIAELRAK